MLELVSVIIPVYNVEKYLYRCLNSVLAQSYKKLEIIVVNDGSKDNSLKILCEFAEKDARINVIDKENEGVAKARNTGIDAANGRYLVFVDSDDYIEKNMIEVLVNLLEQHQVDMSLCKISESGSIFKNQTYLEHFYNHHDLMEGIFKDQEISSHPVNKLYKKELFDFIRYPENTIVEDMAIAHHLLRNVKSAVLTEAPLYIYDTTRITSTSNSYAKRIEASYDRAKVMLDRIALAEKEYPDLVEVVIPQAAVYLLSSYAKMLSEKEKLKSERLKIKEEFKKREQTYLHCNQLNLIYKLCIYSILYDLDLITFPICWGYRFLLNRKFGKES